MKLLLFFLLVFIFTSSSTYANPLGEKELREEYYRAAEDSSASDKFYKKMQSISGEMTPVILGYKGMSGMLKAKHSSNPINKLSFFSDGKKILEQAIAQEPTNVELRFLRYGVQDNAPFFLDYSGDMTNDRKVLISYLESTDLSHGVSDLTKRIMQYLKDQKKLSKEELVIIKRVDAAAGQRSVSGVANPG